MSLKKPARQKLTVDGTKLGQGKTTFPRVVKPAIKKERFTAAEEITELRQKLADLDIRVQALERQQT